MIRQGRQARRPHGFTLAEMLIAVTIAVIVFTIVMRAFSTSTKSGAAMSNQVDMSERQYQVLGKMAQDLMQAGADMPQLDTAIVVPKSDSIVLYVNPKGAYCPITVTGSVTKLCVGDTTPFSGLASVRHFVYDVANPTWVARTVASRLKDTIVFSGAVSLGRGDVIYYREMRSYYRDAGLKQVILRNHQNSTTDPLAEYVSALSFTFRDTTGGTTTRWAKMKTCSLCVTMYQPAEPAKTKTACRRFFFRNRSSALQ